MMPWMERAAMDEQSLIGTSIGNYQVTGLLGEGGMGVVYRAEHPLIGKKVAIKVLHRQYSSNTDVVARFFTEAKAVNDIGHPNIVDIVDFGELTGNRGDRLVYFIMELLQGSSLAQAVRQGAPMAPDRAFYIAAQVADALAASHAQGIIHRDLKPDNIFLVRQHRQDDFVKVLDFGIAKLTGDRTAGSQRTHTGMVMGTPAYMSPEQCEGKGDIDKRTDVYALGVVLYEMLTGRLPFVGEGFGQIVMQHITQPPPPLATVVPGISPHVEATVMTSLAKAREHRYQSMEQFAEALRGGAVAAPTAMPMVRTTLSASAGEVSGAVPKQTPRSSAAKWASLTVAAVAVAAVVAVFAMPDRGGDSGEGEPISAAAPAAPGSPETEPVATPDPVLRPAVERVVVGVRSVPPGAELFVGDEEAPRGNTPYELELEKGSGDTVVKLVLDGYEDRERTVGSDRDTDLEIPLTKQRTRTRTRAERTRTAKPKTKTEPKKSSLPEDDIAEPTF
jgi:serine/threonine-protein kinase